MNERKYIKGRLWVLIPLSVIIFCAVLSSYNNGGTKLNSAGFFDQLKPENERDFFRVRQYQFERVEADGHLWLFGGSQYSDSKYPITMLHHPDCACGKGGK